MGELVNGRRHLQALFKDSALSLKPNVFRPPHEVAEVTLRLNVLTNTEVFRSLFKEGILDFFCDFFSGNQRGWRNLLLALFLTGLLCLVVRLKI